jgi:predicted dehydrogenase
MEEVTVALVGLGGYGSVYTRMLLERGAEHGARLTAGIDPYASQTGNLEKFQLAGIPIFENLQAFYAVSTADLVIISTGIHLHAPLTILALEHGSNVLCEKPLCAGLEDARRMMDAEMKSGKFVAIGYQWSYSRTIQELKADILSGRLGRPLRFKSLVLWPRAASYYQRNDWAGKIHGPAGELVLDSPLHNATAHYLHNLFFLLGEAPMLSANLGELQAECYRVNAIENYDAAALRCQTDSGVEILYYAAHSVPKEYGPWVYLEFDQAVVEYRRGEMVAFTARFSDGRFKDYGDPFSEEDDKLWQSVELVRHGGRPACGIQASLAQLLSIHAVRQSSEILTLPSGLVQEVVLPGGDRLYCSQVLEECLLSAWDRNQLPADLENYGWTRSGKKIQRVRIDFPT